MNMKEKYFAHKKGVKKWKTAWYWKEKDEWKGFHSKYNKKISNAKDTFVCFVTSSLDTRHYFNVYTLFIRTSKTQNWTLGLLSINFWSFLGCIFLNLFLFFPDFFFRSTVMIYNNRKSERRKAFWCSFSVQSVKNHGTK